MTTFTPATGPRVRAPACATLAAARRQPGVVRRPSIGRAVAPRCGVWSTIGSRCSRRASWCFVAGIAFVVPGWWRSILISRIWDSLISPGRQGHLLGTDQFGRDVLLRLIDGARVSLSVGVLAVAIGAIFGGAIGLVSGYFGGRVDGVLMRLIDVKLAFPGILAALVIVTVLGGGLDKAMVAVGIGRCALRARRAASVMATSTRSSSKRRAAWVLARADHVRPHRSARARSADHAGHARVGHCHFWRQRRFVSGPGAQPPTAEWGLMLSESRKYLRIAWWLAVFQARRSC